MPALSTHEPETAREPLPDLLLRRSKDSHGQQITLEFRLYIAKGRKLSREMHFGIFPNAKQ